MAAVVDDIVVGIERAAESQFWRMKLPDVFLWVELSARRQRQSEMLFGTFSLLVVCQPARPKNKTACEPAATAFFARV
jgi:hypothetical protein